MKKIIISRRSEKKKRGKWYYIMLAVTLLTVGAVALLTRNTAEKILNHNIEMSEAALESSTSEKNSEPLIKVITDEKKITPLVKEPSVSEKKLEFVKPLDGEVIKGHSNTELVYSKTLGDWRIHKGVDIASPIGTDVLSSEDGVVDAVYLDDRLGYTVIIKHQNDIRTKYSNLSEEIAVSAGQSVKKGDIIGMVGDTSEFEIADASHLHYEVMKGEDNIAPDLYIAEY